MPSSTSIPPTPRISSIHDLRLPRTASAAVVVGVALGVAGALMQAVAPQSPRRAWPAWRQHFGRVAWPWIGAVWLFHVTGLSALVWVAFRRLGHRRRPRLSPRLDRPQQRDAGSARASPAPRSTPCSSPSSSAVLLLSKATFDVYRFWMVGSLDRQRTHRPRRTAPDPRRWRPPRPRRRAIAECAGPWR